MGSLQLLEFSHDRYNALQGIVEVDHHLRTGTFFDRELHEIFAAIDDAGLSRLVGVALLHGHFDAAPGQAPTQSDGKGALRDCLVTANAPVTGDRTPVLLKAAYHDGASVWAVAPLEYSAIAAAKVAWAHIMKQEAGLTRIVETIGQLGLDDLVGLSVLPRTDRKLGSDEAWVEQTSAVGDDMHWANVVAAQRVSDVVFGDMIQTVFVSPAQDINPTACVPVCDVGPTFCNRYGQMHERQSNHGRRHT